MKTATFPHRVSKFEPSSQPRSLTSILLSRSLLVGAGALGLYSAFEIAFDPPTDLLNFITHHFIHVVGIGVAVWWVCWWVVRENVLAPVSAISHHLYRLRSGRLESLPIQTRSSEIGAIITGINSLTDRLKKAKAGELERALTSIQELRVRLGKLSVRDEEQKVPVMKCVTRLESALLGLMSNDTRTHR
jgi:methyl-accepting chemotaxis protein